VKRFKDLLFVFNDGIEANPAFERAAGLARRNDARISVVHCVEGMPEDHASDPHLAET
jgi:nucleotide-binding universal stress UspA family protein